VKLISSKFKVGSLTMNHLFMSVKIWLYTSTRQLTVASVIIILVLSTKRIDVQTKQI